MRFNVCSLDQKGNILEVIYQPQQPKKRTRTKVCHATAALTQRQVPPHSRGTAIVEHTAAHRAAEKGGHCSLRLL